MTDFPGAPRFCVLSWYLVLQTLPFAARMAVIDPKLRPDDRVAFQDHWPVARLSWYDRASQLRRKDGWMETKDITPRPWIEVEATDSTTLVSAMMRAVRGDQHMPVFVEVGELSTVPIRGFRIERDADGTAGEPAIVLVLGDEDEPPMGS